MTKLSSFFKHLQDKAKEVPVHTEESNSSVIIPNDPDKTVSLRPYRDFRE